MTILKNREKAVIIDTLKDKYSLSLLLGRLELSKSCYYYRRKQINTPDKYKKYVFDFPDYTMKTFNGMDTEELKLYWQKKAFLYQKKSQKKV